MWPLALVVVLLAAGLALGGVFDGIARAVIILQAWLRAADDELFGR